jgi:thioredoxin 1
MTDLHRVEEFSKPISEKLFDEILSTNEMVITDCFANWCGPCTAFKPLFEEISNKEEFAKIKFISIDTDETRWISNRYDIDSIPRFLFFKNKNLIYEHKGASPPIVFEYFIKTKLLGLVLLKELKDGFSENDFDTLISEDSMVIAEFHPFGNEESEQLKPYYIPLIEEYTDVKFLVINLDSKKTKWARKRFHMEEDFPHFVMIKNGKIVLDRHIHHPDAIKYAIEEYFFERTPFAHDSPMAEEKFDTITSAYENALVFIVEEGNRTSEIMRNYLFHIAERYPDLPLIALKVNENPWLKEKFALEEGEFTRYDETGKKTPYFIFYKNGKVVHESGPLQPEKFEDIIQAKLLKLFTVEEFEHSLPEDKFNSIIKENPLVLCDIGAVWCQPCTEMKPIFRNLSRNHSNIKFISIDLDYSRWIGEKFDIDSIPSFLFFKEGQMVYKHEGFLEEPDFEDKIQEHLK